MLKKCVVLLFPTKEKSNIWLRNDKLEYNSSASQRINPHHLYIISDEEIKKGDWAYSILTRKIKQITDVRTELGNNKGFPYKKVIASNIYLL